MENISKRFNFSPKKKKKSAEVKFSNNNFKDKIDRDSQFQGWLKKKKRSPQNFLPNYFFRNIYKPYINVGFGSR